MYSINVRTSEYPILLQARQMSWMQRTINVATKCQLWMLDALLLFLIIHVNLTSHAEWRHATFHQQTCCRPECRGVSKPSLFSSGSTGKTHAGGASARPKWFSPSHFHFRTTVRCRASSQFVLLCFFDYLHTQILLFDERSDEKLSHGIICIHRACYLVNVLYIFRAMQKSSKPSEWFVHHFEFWRSQWISTHSTI